MLEEDISVLDSLSEILQRMEGVEYSGAIMEHPLTKKTILRVKTSAGKLRAVDAVKKAIQELKEVSAELGREFEKL
ncbi:MAG: RpoL/Rpb11 RNA polymerase subunit family protein [Nitrososphaerota archaeon]